MTSQLSRFKFLRVDSICLPVANSLRSSRAAQNCQFGPSGV